MRDENARLKYRLNILKRATAQEEQGGSNPNTMPDLSRALVTLFQQAVSEAFPSLQTPPCPVVPSAKGGDYQYNGAMAISGLLKAQGQKSNPREVATAVVAKVASSSIVDRLEVAGPGFVNIFLSTSYVEGELAKVLEEGVRPPATGPSR